MTLTDDDAIPDCGALFNFGEIGLEELEPKLWIKNDKIMSLSCGDEFTVIITKSGRAFAYGKNDWGQLGLGHKTTELVPSCIKALKSLNEKALLVACGRNHTLIWTENKKLFGFGCNNDGQLGFEGNVSSVNEPRQVTSWTYGNIIQLAAGGDFSAAINSEGVLYMWGSNSESQLGLGDSLEDVIYNPARVTFFTNAVSYVDCGSYHCAAISNGNLYLWGESANHKLGHNFEENQSKPRILSLKIVVKQVSCGHNHTVCLSEDGDVYVWGKGDTGQLGLGPHESNSEYPKLLTVRSVLVKGHGDSVESVEKFIHIAAGECHTIIVTTKGLALSFGDGRHGKLGNIGGADEYSNYMWPEVIGKLNKDLWVYDAQCGGCHTVVLVRNRESHENINEINFDQNLSTTGIDNSSIYSQTTDLSSTSPRARRHRRELNKSLNSTLPTLTQSHSISNGIMENENEKKKKKKEYSNSNDEIEEHINIVKSRTVQSEPTDNLTDSNNHNEESKESQLKDSNSESQPQRKRSESFDAKVDHYSALMDKVFPIPEDTNDGKTNIEKDQSNKEVKPSSPETANVGCSAGCKKNQDENKSKTDIKKDQSNNEVKPPSPETANVGCLANCKKNQALAPEKNSGVSQSDTSNNSSTSVNQSNKVPEQKSKACSIL